MILEYAFFQNAILGSLLASILCGIVGTYIVTRRLVFISGGLTHASFGGIGLGVFLGLDPILSAMVFATASALGVQWMSNRGDVREDSAIAMFWTLGMSVGIVFSFLTPGFMSDLTGYLFGSILTIGRGEVGLLAVLTAITVLIFTFFYRQILSVAFDRIFARSQHLPVDGIEYGMMVVIALTIVAVLRLVGIVLALSLLTIPQMTANLLTHSYKRMMFLSILFGWAGCLCGLFASYWLDVPSGASIICVSILLFVVVKVFCVLQRTGGVAASSREDRK